MRTHIRPILTLIFISFVFGSAVFRPVATVKQNFTFKVRFEQDGNPVEILNHTLHLKPTPFDIIFELPQPMGILVNGSLNDLNYLQAAANKPLHKLPGFAETGMAEEKFNPGKEILLAEDAPGYWYFASHKAHRFNQVFEKDAKLICRRTVQKLVETSTEKEIKISEVSKPLYLIFISYKPAPEITDRIEVQRQYVTLNWKK